jgi:hypothetical protein
MDWFSYLRTGNYPYTSFFKLSMRSISCNFLSMDESMNAKEAFVRIKRHVLFLLT